MKIIDDVKNHITEHQWLTNYSVDWESAQCPTYSTNYFPWFTLESWLTSIEQTPLNRWPLLLAPFKWLICDINMQINGTEQANFTDELKLTNTWFTSATWVIHLITSQLNWPVSIHKLNLVNLTDNNNSLDSDDDFHSGNWNVSDYYWQQFYTGLMTWSDDLICTII